MEKNCLERLQDREIPMEEFNRLNVMEVLAAKYHEIMAPESYQYLKGILEAQAPTPEKKISDLLQEIEAQREEILRAFIAKFGCNPEEAEQVEFKNEDGMPVWRVRRILPGAGVPLPIEIVEALRESERALIGADACLDQECGSDQCAALQMIRALLPPGEMVPGASCAEIRRARQEERKTPAARPSLSLE